MKNKCTHQIQALYRPLMFFHAKAILNLPLCENKIAGYLNAA
jgi:hypothetical protein